MKGGNRRSESSRLLPYVCSQDLSVSIIFYKTNFGLSDKELSQFLGKQNNLIFHVLEREIVCVELINRGVLDKYLKVVIIGVTITNNYL